MRKVKFRAWDEEFNKMIFQHDMNAGLENREYYFSLSEESIELLHYDRDYSAYVRCNAELMQYTGMKDINGKEIYEDDIVKVSERMAGEDFIGKVIYDKSEGCYLIMQGNERNNCKIIFDLDDFSHYVIGNIYENLELLDN